MTHDLVEIIIQFQVNRQIEAHRDDQIVFFLGTLLLLSDLMITRK